MADIATDGPFSAFPGIERWFAALAGAGVVLAFPEGERRVITGDPPVRFDGGSAPGCRLLDGPTCDLNLMQRGGRATMRPVEAGRLVAGLYPWKCTDTGTVTTRRSAPGADLRNTKS
jgi:environmental stress-induced protein Ves